jgi:hypothetical protein
LVGIDLDQARFNELYKNMKARFKTSGSQAQMRQAAEFNMVPLFEYLRELHKQIVNNHPCDVFMCIIQ